MIPSTIGLVPGTHTHVAGETAGSRDFGHQLGDRAPLVFDFVLILAFLLLLSAFRSLTIALTAIALNLLSIGTSYGAMVLVFQHQAGRCRPRRRRGSRRDPGARGTAPSIMCLLGERNWYLPKFLRWLPQEKAEVAAPVPQREQQLLWR